MSDLTPASAGYGGLDLHCSEYDTARVLIWPVPYEKTVSYGHGTAEGPAAIIAASSQMELYDEELGGETAEIGIHTLPEMSIDCDPPEMMTRLRSASRDLLQSGKFLCMLGGEHSISPPVVYSHAEKYSNLSVLQIDAHADLRESYQDSPYSHACAMRRILEVCPVVQVGIRSISTDEARALPGLRSRMFYAKDIVGRKDWMQEAVDALTENVYLTIDVDGLDPSLVPTTGTPEPGGLLWYELLDFLRAVAKSRRIVGMDVVELSGGSESNAPAFLTSKLIYKCLGYIFSEHVPRI